MTDSKIIPFGKYKGRLIEEVLVDDPQYLQWLTQQDWMRDKFPTLLQIIINRGAEPEETPEHNALQVKFLDDDFCLTFVRHFTPDIDAEALKQATQQKANWLKDIENQIAGVKKDLQAKQERLEHFIKEEEAKSKEHTWYGTRKDHQEKVDQSNAELLSLVDRQRKLFEKPVTGQLIFRRAFEVRGVDVVLSADLAYVPDHKIWPKTRRYSIPFDKFRSTSLYIDEAYIELKPIIGDDYPAVLRQMKLSYSNMLLVGIYSGQGATREQFVATFATANIRVVFIEDLENKPGKAGKSV